MVISDNTYGYKRIVTECKEYIAPIIPDLNNIASDIHYKNLNNYIHDTFNGNKMSRTYVVAYLDYKVLVGLFEDELVFYLNERFDPKYLNRLRVFNEDSELLLLREKPSFFKGRLRNDRSNGQGEEIEVVDTLQVLWGTRKVEIEDKKWVQITEERGTSLTLPFAYDEFNIDDKQKRVKLKTRHYIQYNTLGQAGYFDCRFMNIIPYQTKGV